MYSKRTRFTVVLAALLACLLCQVGWAATYYVAPGGVDDVFGGTEAAPWASINFGDANLLLAPGDTVVVAAGTYVHNTAAKGTINKCSGTEAAPITYLAQGNVIIDGQGSTASTYSCMLFSGGIDHIVFDGFDLRGARRGLNITGTDTTTGWCEGIVIRNCKIHEMHGGFAVQNAMIRKCMFNNNVIYTYSTTEGTMRGISSSTAFGNKFYNNTIYVTGPNTAGSPWGGGIYFGGKSTQASIASELGTDEVKNNIIWPTYGGAGAVGLYAYNATQIDPINDPGWFGIPFIHSNNMYWPNYLAMSWIYHPVAFQMCNLYDVGFLFNESYANPMFVNAAAGDFTLAAASPAIDAGVDVGLPFQGAAPDLGAFESTPQSFDKIGTAMAQPNNSVLKLTCSVVTVETGALKDNMIYVEDESRAAGVAVRTTALMSAVAEGQRVEITGRVDKSGVQPMIVALDLASATGSGTAALTPLGTAGKSVASIGLDNTGLLVTVWGKLAGTGYDVGTGNEWLCVDDGSGTSDGLGVSGIPVLISDLVTPLMFIPSVNDKVAVTGVIGKADLGGGVVPIIRLRGPDDIVPYNTVP